MSPSRQRAPEGPSWIWRPFTWLARVAIRAVRAIRTWVLELLRRARERRLKGIVSWMSNWRFGTLVKIAVIGLVVVVAALNAYLAYALYWPSPDLAARAPQRTVVYQDQGWGCCVDSAARQTYYYTPQGTSLLGTPMRYSWLVNLERRPLYSFFGDKQERLMDPAITRAMGFLVDEIATPMNPDRLPVGFTRHYDPQIGENVLDLTCAACHTGELQVVTKTGQTVSLRIDGGQANHAFTTTRPGHFGSTVLAAMSATLVNPWAFNRFARRVLGDRYYEGKSALRWEFAKVTTQLTISAVRDKRRHLYPIEEGFGRTDAIARISNMVFGTELDAKNYIVGDAPVSFPAVWDSPRFDWVQYAGSVSQPLARNMGESLGVGAVVRLTDGTGRPLPAQEQFTSTAMVDDQVKIEENLRKLKQPRWPEDLLGPVDTNKAQLGRTLYLKHCAHCHSPCVLSAAEVKVERPTRDPNDPFWHVNLIDIRNVGTDPQAALNFANSRLDLSKAAVTRERLLGLARDVYEEDKRRRLAAFPNLSEPQLECEVQQKLAAINPSYTTIGQALNYMDMLLADRFFRLRGLDPKNPDQLRIIENYQGEGALDDPQVKLVYKARPLGGVWATAPYLHNGSVPTLYEMLVPASERSKRFYIPSQLEFDPVRVGLSTSAGNPKGMWFDTTIPGNRNIGHEFRAGYAGASPKLGSMNGVIGPLLTDQERWAIIEYLKIHNDDDAKPCSSEPGSHPEPSAACRKG